MSEEYEYQQPQVSGYTIYSKSGCPNCTKVKNYLKNVNAPVELVDCDDYLIENKEAFLKFISELAGSPVKMFPIVFFQGKFVGGYTETEVHYNRNSAFSDNMFF
jgi:glutaredoxin